MGFVIKLDENPLKRQRQAEIEAELRAMYGEEEQGKHLQSATGQSSVPGGKNNNEQSRIIGGRHSNEDG